MSKIIELAISFSSPEPKELIKAICRNIEPFNERLPTVSVDYSDEYKEINDWIDKLIPKCEFSIMADWGDVNAGEYNEGWISYKPDGKIIKIQINDYELTDAQSVIEMLASLPWTVISISDIHDDDNWYEHRSSLLGGSHFPIGWACAFKGSGHARLVSRRWLNYHPWYLIRDEKNDVSFVQFHEIDADPITILEQAIPGHRAMGQGFIDKTHPFSNHPQKLYFDREFRGIYFDDTGEFHVVIPAGVPVTLDQMYDYCAAKYYQIFEQGTVKKLVFVFIEGKEAEPYLHDLWLRDIECLGIDPTGERYKVDENYHPDYEPPQWVKRLQQREQQSEIEEKKLELAQVEKKIESLNQRIKNSSVGVLTGELSQNEALISRNKELKKELIKQKVVKQNLEKEITNLENSNSKEFT